MSRNRYREVKITTKRKFYVFYFESFTYSDGIIRGEVHASMRNKVYKETVSNGLDDGIGCMFSSPLNVTLAVINTLIERLCFNSYIFLQ